MKKLLLFSVLAIILISSCTSNHSTLLRIQVNGLYGFIDTTGNEVINPQYKYVSNFTTGGYATVISKIKATKDSGLIVTYGYVNKFNELVIDTTNLAYKSFRVLKSL